MSLIDRMGLGPKPGRPRRRAFKLEGRPSQASSTLSGRHLWERVGLFAALVLLSVLAYPRVQFYENTTNVGDVWRSDEVVAPFNFPIRLTEEELQARRDSVRADEPPIFAANPEALRTTEARLDTLGRQLGAAVSAYVGWQLAARDGDRGPARVDSARFLALRDAVPVALSEEQWGYLLGDAAARAGLTEAATAGAPLVDRLVASVGEVAGDVVPRGVLNVPADSVVAAQVVVRDPDPRVRVERVQLRSDVLGVDEAYDRARGLLGLAFDARADTVRIGMALFRHVLEPSLLYQPTQTQERLTARLAEVNPTRGLVKQGIIIVRRGDEVTPEVYRQLASLEIAERERSGEISFAQGILGQIILVMAAYAVFFLYLFLLRRTVFDEFRHLLLIALLFGASVIGFGVAVRVDGVGELAVPVAIVSILLTILFDSRVGMFATITLALLGGLIFGYDYGFALATVFAGSLAVFSVRDVKNRSQLVLTAGLVLAAYLFVLFGYALLRSNPFDARLMTQSLNVLVNAVLLLLASPLLWAFERSFGFTTDLTLLELSDTNRPVLKELSLRAPGTFNHVLQVANLAEAAADAVGANALRARVGALYHDIGKMLKPEYFIENQHPGENPHERLSPSMSALVIAGHVKDGLELGREHGLPRVVLDFISTHHGTSLMEYFYRKAEEQRDADDPPVDPSEFRYPGPRPTTNEQAIVMLADSVEAASRSLAKPTPQRLEALIDALFRARVDDGQLDLCSLTFADLTRVKETFLSLLCGIYHFRVKYPGQDEALGAQAEVEASGDGAPPAEVESNDPARPSSQERATMG